MLVYLLGTQYDVQYIGTKWILKNHMKKKVQNMFSRVWHLSCKFQHIADFPWKVLMALNRLHIIDPWHLFPLDQNIPKQLQSSINYDERKEEEKGIEHTVNNLKVL